MELLQKDIDHVEVHNEIGEGEEVHNEIGEEEKKNKKQRWTITFKVLLVSVSFLFMFTSYSSMQNLHSSINREENLGTVSVSVIYATLVLTALITPGPLITFFGYKWTMVLSFMCYVAYMALNFYPTWGTLIPASVIIGIGASSLWTAKCGLLTTLGRQYARLSKEDPSVVVTRFFGIFFLFFQSCKLTGNLISSLVLKVDVINGSITEETLSKCGAKMCMDPVNNTNLERPSQQKFLTMMGIYLGFSIAATLMIAIFLPNEERVSKRPSAKIICKNIKNALKATYKQAFDARQILVWPITIYSGLEQGYISGDFTKSYVSCSLGIGMVGYVMMCYGAVDAVLSWFTSRLRKYTGRIPLFLFGTVVNLAMQILMLVWAPHPSQLPVFFIISGLWGAGDAIWQTHVNGVYGSFFGVEADAAFSYYRLMESFGFVISFAYSGSLCTSTKLYILICTLIISIVCYLIAEYIDIKLRKKEKAEEMVEMNEKYEKSLTM